MNPIHLAYNLIGHGSALALIPLLWLHDRFQGRNSDRFRQRLGFYPETLRQGFQGNPRIWLHAVSVGEVGVAAAIIKALHQCLPHCQIALSTTTEQGLAQARMQLGEDVSCFYAPLDLIGATQKALKMVQPHILALLETEIWPNLIITAQRMGVRTAILNGRISTRTIYGYRKIRPLMCYTLSHVNAFSMISSTDARRIRSLGAPEDRIAVNGNAKFDGPDPLTDAHAHAWATTLFGLQAAPPVFVAGSTREPEEQTLLDAYLQIRQSFPEALLIIAPRHTERTPQIEQWIRDRGLACQRRTSLDGLQQPRTAPVIILDTMGELSATYSVASFVFCGGSLVPKGGQNVLEPAMWGKPVIHGPSMEDFAGAQQLIASAGGCLTVGNAEQLAAAAVDWLRHPEKARSAGHAARQAILAHRGAAQKHAAVITRLLQ